jgi:cell division septation protein DedD
MFSILDLKHQEPAAAPPVEEEKLEAPVEAVETAPDKPEDSEYEYILGRRQIASLLFVSTIVLMVCIAVSYLAGKAMGPKTVAAAPPPTVATQREPEPPPIILNQEPAPEAPLFAEPKNGSVYIQMGAVEKGVAVIFAEGLRKRGLDAFVAPGPSEKIFRVLIGPLPDPPAYLKAKEVVDKIGLSTFARRFPN